jgi:bla regulator protein blaR1
MMLYLLKTVICSAFFLGVYYVLLEKAKMPRFNRFYLLAALIASSLIPLITFTKEVPVLISYEDVLLPAITEHLQDLPQAQQPAKTAVLPFIINGIYWVVAFILLVRFIRNILRLILLIRKNPVVTEKNSRIVLLPMSVMPFSFFHYVFIGERDHRSGIIEREVMHHEIEHVTQKHSIDILLIELLMVFSWFNPFLILYRKAIQLNHEFLADQAVVSAFHDPFAYQVLLLNKISQANQLYPVSSSFSYQITKKRLVMITNPFNRRSNLLRAIAVVPCVITAVVLFSEQVIAQVPVQAGTAKRKSSVQPSSSAPQSAVHVFGNNDTSSPRKVKHVFPLYGGTAEGASGEMMREYKAITDRYATISKQGHQTFDKFSEDDRKRLKEIFAQMNRQQQAQQVVAFLEPLKPLQKVTPSTTLMQSFGDASKYGVWIDLKRVPNESLSNYANTEFSGVTISKLYGKAKEGRSYTHQVNLTTNAAFEEENARRRANKEPHLVFVAPTIEK